MVVIIPDVSGSMGRTDAAGTPLLNGAKAAVLTVVEDLPAGTRVGLRAYGHAYAGDDPAVGCTDGALLAPAASANTNAISLPSTGSSPPGSPRSAWPRSKGETYFGVPTLSDRPASVTVSVDDVLEETADRWYIRVESQSREHPTEVPYSLQVTIETTTPPPSPRLTTTLSMTGAPVATDRSGRASLTPGDESGWPTWALVAAGVAPGGAGAGGWLLARSRTRTSTPGSRR